MSLRIEQNPGEGVWVWTTAVCCDEDGCTASHGAGEPYACTEPDWTPGGLARAARDRAHAAGWFVAAYHHILDLCPAHKHLAPERCAAEHPELGRCEMPEAHDPPHVGPGGPWEDPKAGELGAVDQAGAVQIAVSDLAALDAGAVGRGEN